MPHLTAQVSNLERVGPELVVAVAVPDRLAEVMREQGETVPAPVQVDGRVDTGAGGSAIRQDLAVNLGLEVTGETLLHHVESDGEGVNVPTYDVKVVFPAKPRPVSVELPVVGATLGGSTIDLLIGRDILSHGLLVYNGPEDSFTLSF